METCHEREVRRQLFPGKGDAMRALPLNNPGRFQLMDMAEDLQGLAKELEMQVAQQAEFAPAIRIRAAS